MFKQNTAARAFKVMTDDGREGNALMAEGEFSGIKFRPATKWSIFENWPSHWPDKEHFASQHEVKLEQKEELEALLEDAASEREIEDFLANNREVLALVPYLYMTGHHAAWIYPKAQIRPANDGIPGLIPDYVLAGASSDGVSWFVLELKGPREKMFIRRHGRIQLSATANEGISQLQTYIDVMTRSQSYLREELKLAGFREPRGVLMIGTEQETNDEDVRDFKAAWNRNNVKLQIRTYSALLHLVEGKLRDFNREQKDSSGL